MEELKKLMNNLGNKNVIRTVPMKKEWIDAFEELTGMSQQIETLLDDISKERGKLWHTIEGELNEYGNMQVNKETNEIEVMGEGKNRSNIPSPYIKPKFDDQL